MAKTDINENIYRAIDTIIDARLQNVNFNSTVLCTIVDDSKAASGIFTVDNLGVQFQATSMDKSFKVNDQVYVTVPNNNFDAQKIIIGKKEDFAKLQEQWKDPFSYLEFKYQFDDDSDEVEITPTGNGQVSNKTVKRIILDDSYFNENWLNTRVNKYSTITDAKIDLINSGWTALNVSELEFKNYPSPFRTILQRNQGTCGTTETFYRIKNLSDGTVPITANSSLNKYSYSIDLKQSLYGYGAGTAEWQEKGRWSNDSMQHCLFNLDELIDPIPLRKGSTQIYFPLFYNEKQYRPILLAGLKNIVITVDIQSDITFLESAPSAGTYKFQCQLIMVHQNDSTNEKTLTMTIASDTDFLGDPYNYFDYFTQQVVFDITNYQDYIVNKIEFSVIQNGDFTNIDSGIIKIKNPKIYFGLPLKENTIGYKGVSSVFRTNGSYYQKTSPIKLGFLRACIVIKTPIDTELETDGPFDVDLSDDPDNPQIVKRYKPKVYIKTDAGYEQHENIKYYDQIWKHASFSLDNPYVWNSDKQQWWDGVNESSYIDFYVKYPPGREISGYTGIMESSNEDESVPPQIGISSAENNVDVALLAQAKNSNILISAQDVYSRISLTAASNRNITLNENEDIVINNNGKTSIDLDNDNLTVRYKKDNNNEMTFRLGYQDNAPAINLAVKTGGSWGQVHLTASKLNYLATLLEGH